MKINNFPKYIFWSYKENADLPESVIARNVLQYGDVKDMILLTKLVDKKEIKKVVEKLSVLKRERKRINFFNRVIL